MGLFKNIKDVMEFVNSDDFAFKWPRFDDKKVKEVEAELKLKETSKKDGLQGMPPSSATSLSTLESEANKICSNFYTNIVTKGKEHFKKIEDSANILNSTISNKNTYFTEVLNGLQQKHDTSIQGHTDKVNRKDKIIEKEKTNYNKFKLEHELTREAEPYTQASRIKTYSIVLGLLLFEVIVNMNILGAVSEGGAQEGLFVSTSVAFLNVFVSSLIGFYLVKKINLTEEKESNKAIIYRNIYLIIIVYVNLVFASYRALLGLSDGIVVNYNQVITPWLVLPNFDFQSVILFLVGVSFAGIAMFDGYKFDDKFPHFGQMKRNLDNQINERQALIDDMRKHEEKIFNETFDDGIEIERTEKKYVLGWSKIINNYQTYLIDFPDVVKQLQDQGYTHIVDEYRKENKKFRGGVKEPEYFKDSTDLGLDKNAEKVFSASYQLFMNDTERLKRVEELENMVNEKYEKFLLDFTSKKEELRNKI